MNEIPPIERARTPDIESSVVLGRISGPIRSMPDITIERGDHTKKKLTKPQETRYVLILDQGQLYFQHYNLERHGEYNDIPQISCTIPNFIEQIEGFGETEKPLGEQFRQVRFGQGSARRTKYPIDHPDANTDYRIPFPRESFAFEESRLTISRVEKNDLTEAA
jgi:hypothetical protein